MRSIAASGATVRETLREAERLYREGKPSDALLCARALGEIAPALLAAGHRELRTFIARSVSLEPVLPFLQIEAALDGFVLRAELGGYGSFMDELMNVAGPLRDSSSFDLVVLALDLEDIAGRLPDLCASGRGDGVASDGAVEAELAACVERMRSMLESLRGRVASRILVQGFVVPDRTALGDAGEANLPGGLKSAIRDLNRRVAAMCAGISGCVFFAVDDVAARFGKAAWADERMFLSSRVPMAAAAFPAYARGLLRTVRALFRPMRKVLCTDLDQTFWGGILGEDGPKGIATGTAFPGNCYRAYQQHLKRLRARGVLLAVVSKNNPADVEEAFTMRANDLLLRLEDFSAREIGWGDKVGSLRKLAADLSLGTDSLVFVDDNPTECEAVRQAMPEVAVVEVPPEEPWRFVELVEAGGYFETTAISEDDLRRAEDYRNQTEREALRESLGSREDFLRSLEIVCTFLPATEAPLARSVQLLGKTNQFNLTTRRHGAADVERFQNAPGGQAFALRVRDRFGDSGVVGLLLAQTEGAVCRIDTLLLSCRVIGRDIERAMLAACARRAQADGARGLLGEFRPTKKNGLAAGFYASCGFQNGIPDGVPVPVAEDGSSEWYWYDFEGGLPPIPEFLTLEGAADESARAVVVA
ncbi:HAD-IIIC family phosphatase [Terriglobus sp.]|uniref:HAD-IIIC family phosphatase n=1 Tax=Terriglobus sp. TaxID=1889013 RepID=UPI003B00D0B5